MHWPKDASCAYTTRIKGKHMGSEVPIEFKAPVRPPGQEANYGRLHHHETCPWWVLLPHPPASLYLNERSLPPLPPLRCLRPAPLAASCFPSSCPHHAPAGTASQEGC